MSSSKRFSSFSTGWRRPGSVLATAFAVFAAGCSADVSRFDFPASVSLNEDAGTTGAIPTSTGPVKARSNLGSQDADNGQAYFPPQRPNDQRSVDVSALPAPDQAPSYAPTQPERQPAPSWPVDSRAPAAAPAPASVPSRAYNPEPEPAEIAKGDVIEVRSGDTLYGLSRRHRVSLTELMSVNNLSGPALHPGQKLYLPASAGDQSSVRNEVAAAPEPQQEPAVQAPADWTGTYVLERGDSLYAVARRFNVKQTDLKRYNGIRDVRRLRPGTVLKMPAGAGAQVAANTTSRSDASPSAPPRVVQSVEGLSSEPSAQPTIINQKPAAELTQVAVNTPTAATSTGDGGKLRWPAQGKVIAGFGQRPDGTHNDGINLAVPMGTDVHSAESGVVAYAGDELKGYGNLILLRHDNGWVTAYAHAEQLLVKRGDKVKRGQVIAKAGKTGQVDQPQVHFELRKGQRPVDPTQYLEKL